MTTKPTQLPNIDLLPKQLDNFVPGTSPEFIGAKKRPFVRSAYNYHTNMASTESGLSTPEPTRAQQQFKEECDINTIVRNFGVTGQVPNTAKIASYGDFTGVDDYHSALLQIKASDEAFMALPASLRERFHHDPAKLIKFMENESNRDEAVMLGLVNQSLEVNVVTPDSPSGDLQS